MIRCRLIAPLAALALASGCGGGKAPTGQVVATVDGKEITATELKLELNGARAATPEAQKQLENAALQAIVNRKLLAAAAVEQKVDQLPAYAVARQKAEDLALIEMLQQKIAGSAAKPSPEEVRQFLSQHPDSFAARKIFAIDQLAVPGVSREVVEAMRPLTTLPQIAQMLAQRGVPFRRAETTIDGAATDPELVGKIVAVPAGEAFVTPEGTGVMVNQIRSTEVVPFTGPQAERVASEMLTQSRVRDLVQKQTAGTIKAGQAQVKYNANYGPAAAAATPMPTSQAPAAPAAPAAGAKAPVAVPNG